MIDFFEFSNEMLCLADYRGYFTRVNPAWTRVLGWSAEELTTQPYLEFVHPDDVAATIREAELLQTNHHETVRFTNRYRCRDGSYRWLQWQVVADAARNQLVAAARDVTVERQQAESTRDAIELFRTLAMRAPVGIARADAEGKVFFVNERWLQLAGTTPEENYGFGWKDRVHPDDLPQLLCVWQSAVAAMKDMPPHEFRFVHQNGTVRWAAASVSMIVNDGRLIGQIATTEDVTQRKAAEQALRDSENRFRHLITHAPVGITQADADGRCVFVNRRWCDIVGVTADQAVGEGWRAFVHPDDHDRIVAQFQEAIAAGRDCVGETRYVRPDGEIVWISFSTSGLPGEDGGMEYISTVVDVTERRRAREILEAEQDLLRQSIELKDRELKLIAYDIHDGLIQYAIGALMHVEALKTSTMSETDRRRIETAIEALRATVFEGRRLINGIRTPVLDRHGVVAAIEELAREKSTADVEIEFVEPTSDFGRLPPETEIALYRMSQEALTNAVKHSRSSKVQIALDRDDAHVWLTIEDWGVGMPAKASSRGVHGLSGIKERTKLLKGRFNLESAPGSGTKIEIELPLEAGYVAANASQ